MKLTLEEAKNLYVLLYFEAIDGKEFFIDKLHDYICSIEPLFDVEKYVLTIGWTLLEVRDAKMPVVPVFKSKMIVPDSERWNLKPSDIDSDANAHIYKLEAALKAAEYQVCSK